MMFSKCSCSFLSLFIFPIIIFKASAQSNCTTLQPVFIYPKDGTSTVFASITTTTSAVDCSGCSLAVSTFQAVINPSVSIAPLLPLPYPPTYTCSTLILVSINYWLTPLKQASINTTTLSLPLTTSSTFFCAPSTTSPEPTTPISLPSGPVAQPTASPLPPLNGTASTLIPDLQTALLYLELLGNANLRKLCSVINPAALSNITGINGTAVQSEVCGSASVEKFDPALAEIAAASNRLGVDFVFTALFAVCCLSFDVC